MTSLIFQLFPKMAFSEEDKHVIKFLRQNKHYGAKRFVKEFPHKGWPRSGLDNIIHKIDRTGTLQRLPGRDCLCTAQTNDKIEEVETLVLNKEDLSQTLYCEIIHSCFS